jgi:hypothetical protein
MSGWYPGEKISKAERFFVQELGVGCDDVSAPAYAQLMCGRVGIVLIFRNMWMVVKIPSKAFLFPLGARQNDYEALTIRDANLVGKQIPDVRTRQQVP